MDLAKRVRRLEITNRVLLAAAVLLPMAGASHPSRVLRAEKLVLQDAKGRERIRLGCNAQGDVEVALLTETGANAVALATRAGGAGSGVMVADANGTPMLTAEAQKDGLSALTLFRPDGTRAIMLGADQKGVANVIVLDEKGDVAHTFPAAR